MIYDRCLRCAARREPTTGCRAFVDQPRIYRHRSFSFSLLPRYRRESPSPIATINPPESIAARRAVLWLHTHCAESIRRAAFLNYLVIKGTPDLLAQGAVMYGAISLPVDEVSKGGSARWQFVVREGFQKRLDDVIFCDFFGSRSV